MKPYHFSTAIIAAFALSGCFGGGGGGGSSPSNLAGFLSSVESLGDEGENFSPVAVSDLPDRADMNGHLAAELDESDSVFVGKARGTADFRAGTLTGSADDFKEYEATAACDDGFANCATEVQAIEGSIDINGTITGNTFTYNTNGTLSGQDEDGNPTTAEIDMDGRGGFGTVDENLTALGVHEGTAQLSSSAGTLTSEANGVIILQE